MNEHHLHVLFFFYYTYEYTESCLEKGEHTLHCITVFLHFRFFFFYSGKIKFCFTQTKKDNMSCLCDNSFRY